MKSFFTPNARSPKTFVDRIFHFFEISLIAVLFQIVDLVVAGQCHVACRSDDFNVRSHDLECKVETNLVVSGTGRSVGYGIRTDFLSIVDNGHCLKNTFGRYADRIGAVTENVTGDHIFDALVVIIFGDIQGSVRSGTEILGATLYDG